MAKQIAAIVAPKGLWWEPFCGGLSVSVELAKFGPGLVSDGNEALIALYQAVRAGWVPPDSVSREQYQAAKSLPNSDPLKAFVGFGCSFGGKWFAGYVKEGRIANYATGPVVRNPLKATSKAIARDLSKMSACELGYIDFLSVVPDGSFSPEAIYCDPPYQGTTGYDAFDSFDHGRFWALCQSWAARGSRVFVSEYACPIAADVVWQTSHDVTVKGKTEKNSRIEKLFRVLP